MFPCFSRFNRGYWLLYSFTSDLAWRWRKLWRLLSICNRAVCNNLILKLLVSFSETIIVFTSGRLVKQSGILYLIWKNRFYFNVTSPGH